MKSHHRTRLGFAALVILAAGCAKESGPRSGTGGSEVETGGSGEGGGLAGFHAASSTTYGTTGPFTVLIGAETKDQGGGFRMSDCFPETTNPSVAKLPTPFPVANEEFYTFNGLNPANQVVLRCNA